MDWEKGFVAGNRAVFIGNCPWLWNNWFELGGGCSPSVPRGEAFPLDWVCRALGFTPCHHLTPQGAFPASSSSVFPNLGGAGCTRSCSISERRSLRVKHLLVLWRGSAPSPAIPGGAGPCGSAGAGHGEGLLWGWACPCSGSGGHHSNPSFGLAHP